MLLLLLLIGGGSYAWGESYAITFGNDVGSATPISKTTKAATVIAKGTEYVVAQPFSVTGNCYYGDEKESIRLSKSGKSATLTIALSDAGKVNATSVVVRAKLYNENKPATLACNNQTAQSLTKDYANYTFTLDGSQLSSLVLSSSNYLYVASIEVNYSSAPAANLTSIAVSGTPTKTTYEEGEAFDPTGLFVTATYDDESTRVVTNGVKWTCTPETLILGATEVNVTATYGEKTAGKTVAVTVTEAPKTVDIDLTKDQTTTATTDKLEWLGEFVTVTANKAANGTNANNYYPGTTGKEYTSTRFYKNSTLTFTPAPFVVLGEITYVATASKDETAIKYANVMENSTWTNATAKANGKIVTITPIDGTKPVSAKISDTTGGKSFSINYSLANETSLTLVAKSNDIYYATFSSASACEFAGADVFTVNVEGDNIVLNEVASKQVPANTGVLVKSTANAVTVTRLESAPAIEGTNLLKPASEKMTEGFKFYKLAYDNYTEKTGLGFYWGAVEGGAFTVKPGLAYLAVPQAQAANVKGFSFDGTQTGINGVEATTAKGAIYNLNGQRVEKAQRGIYIQNGKKFIVK